MKRHSSRTCRAGLLTACCAASAAWLGVVGCNAIDGLKDVPGVTVGSDAGDSGKAPLPEAGHDAHKGAEAGHRSDSGSGGDAHAHADAHDSATSDTSTGSDAQDACATPCGGVCCSGVCLNNQCQTTLASRQNPVGIAANATDVYWTNAPSFGNQGAVLRYPVSGGVLATVYPEGSPFAIALSQTQVFWTDSASQAVMAQTFTSHANTSLYAPSDSSSIGFPCAIAVAPNGDVVFVTQGEEGALFEATPADGGFTTAEVLQSTAAAGLQPVAADETYAYWSSGPLAQPNFGGVTQAPLATAFDSIVTLASTPVQALAVQGGNAYWITPGGTVSSVPTSGGGSVVTIASGIDMPVALALDDSYIYWTTNPCSPGDTSCPGGGVFAAPLAPVNGMYPVATLATGQEQPVAIAVTDNAVYWANAGSTVDAGANTGSIVELTPKLPQ